LSAFRLFGITLLEGHHSANGEIAPFDGTGAEVLAFRDLAAVVHSSDYLAHAPAESDVADYQRVVEAVFSHRPVLPAPVGTVFRTKDTLLRWMELHYVALSDALAFVEDRAVARVHIRRSKGRPDDMDRGADLAAAAAESFRALRRHAVTAVTLKTEHITGIVLSSAFLVDRELWKEFVAAVKEEEENRPDLTFNTTGPWPPYDFVRMQFGG
jgi:hypothetical protein